MSYQGLFIALLLLALTLTLVALHFWPRDEKGALLPPEEVEKLLDRFPTPKTHRSVQLLIGVFATVAMIAVALTKSKDLDLHRD